MTRINISLVSDINPEQGCVRHKRGGLWLARGLRRVCLCVCGGRL